MGTHPPLKTREVIRILERLGFVGVRQRGSHRRFKHPDGRATTVPDHAGRDIAAPLLSHIARDIEMTLDEFYSHR